MTRAKSSPPTRSTATQAKPVARAKAKPAREPTPVVAEMPANKPKHKLVRDSFTIPKSEYALLEALKLRAAKLGRPAKKSEVLRADIGALNAMSDKALLAALGAIPSLKTGRPKKASPAKASAASAE